MISKRRALLFCSFLCLAGGVYALVDGIPGSGSAAAVTAARDAQSAWVRQRTEDIVAQRGWNGVTRPPDAPGTPMNVTKLAGGAAALLAAAVLAVLAMRRRFP